MLRALPALLVLTLVVPLAAHAQTSGPEAPPPTCASPSNCPPAYYAYGAVSVRFTNAPAQVQEGTDTPIDVELRARENVTIQLAVYDKVDGPATLLANESLSMITNETRVITVTLHATPGTHHLAAAARIADGQTVGSDDVYVTASGTPFPSSNANITATLASSNVTVRATTTGGQLRVSIARTDAGSFPFYVSYHITSAPADVALATRANGTTEPLMAGATRDDTIAVTFLGHPDQRTYSMELEVSGSGAPAPFAPIRLPINVTIMDDTAPPGFSPTLVLHVDAPILVARGSTASAVARLENTGDARLRVSIADLTPTDDESMLGKVTLVPLSVDVPAHATVDITLTIAEPANATLGPRDEGFIVIADVANAPPPPLLQALRVPVDIVPTVMRVEPERSTVDATLHTMSAVVVANPLATGSAAVALVALGAVPFVRREHLRYSIVVPFAALYTRLARADALEHETRDTLAALIRANPGVHYSALRDETRLASGVLVHHLRALERHRIIVSRREGAFRRFFAIDAPAAANIGAPALLGASRARILALLDAGPRTRAELAGALGLTRQAVSYHMKALEASGDVVLRAHENEWRAHRVRTLQPRG